MEEIKKTVFFVSVFLIDYEQRIYLDLISTLPPTECMSESEYHVNLGSNRQEWFASRSC